MTRYVWVIGDSFGQYIGTTVHLVNERVWHIVKAVSVAGESAVRTSQPDNCNVTDDSITWLDDRSLKWTNMGMDYGNLRRLRHLVRVFFEGWTIKSWRFTFQERIYIAFPHRFFLGLMQYIRTFTGPQSYPPRDEGPTCRSLQATPNWAAQVNSNKQMRTIIIIISGSSSIDMTNTSHKYNWI